MWPHPGQRGHSEWPAEVPSEQTQGGLDGQLEQRSPDTPGPRESEAPGPSCPGSRGEHALRARGAAHGTFMTGCAKYRALQSQKPVCIVAETKPLCPAASSGSSVVWALGKERRETRQSRRPQPCAPPTPALQTRRAELRPLGAFRAALTAVPCDRHPSVCTGLPGTRAGVCVPRGRRGGFGYRPAELAARAPGPRPPPPRASAARRPDEGRGSGGDSAGRQGFWVVQRPALPRDDASVHILLQEPRGPRPSRGEPPSRGRARGVPTAHGWPGCG